MPSFDPKFGLQSKAGVWATWLFVAVFTAGMVRVLYLMFFATESNRLLLQSPMGAGIGLLLIFFSFFGALSSKPSLLSEQLRRYGLHTSADLFGRLERIFAFEFGLFMTVVLFLLLWNLA